MSEQNPPAEALPIRKAAAGIITYQNKILLGERLKDPNRGKLVPLGGGIEEDETPQQALSREAAEEANATINVGNKVYDLEIPEPDKIRQIEYYQAELTSDPSALRGDDDLGSPKLYSRQELTELYVGGKVSAAIVPVLTATGWLDAETAD